MTDCPYGFRIVGPTWGERRLVDAAAALTGYAACDPRAQVDREAYLSAFTFPTDFRDLLQSTGSTRGYTGICWCPWLWWDIDRELDLERALSDTRRLVLAIEERYQPGDEDLLLFYSGSKGFHVGLPTALWNPEPSATFNKVGRKFAEQVAAGAGVGIDSGVYDKVRAFRAPNSRHPKTGRHKRRLTYDELMGLSLGRVLQLAEHPEPFGLPGPTRWSDQAATDWRDAERWVAERAKAPSPCPGGAPRLNRQTLEFIRDGADPGDRHRLLFSAAANLAEFGCSPDLAHALLTEAGLDSGLPPREVHRQIQCGLDHGRHRNAPGEAQDEPRAVPEPANGWGPSRNPGRLRSKTG
jgi:hypothetical protein